MIEKYLVSNISVLSTKKFTVQRILHKIMQFQFLASTCHCCNENLDSQSPQEDSPRALIRADGALYNNKYTEKRKIKNLN